MIFGECPYCEHPMTFDVPDQTPVFARATCDKCGKTFWEYYSRCAPMAYTDEEFAASFEVDEDTREIRRRSR